MQQKFDKKEKQYIEIFIWKPNKGENHKSFYKN